MEAKQAFSYRRESEFFTPIAPSPSKIPLKMRTMCANFAKRYSRLIMLHFMITCALLFTFFPILNFFWTYFSDEEQEVE